MDLTTITKTSELTHAKGLGGFRKAVVAGAAGGVASALAAGAGYLESHGSLDTYGWLTVGGGFIVGAVAAGVGAYSPSNDLEPTQIVTPPITPPAIVVSADGQATIAEDVTADPPGRHEAPSVPAGADSGPGTPLTPPTPPPTGAGDVP